MAMVWKVIAVDVEEAQEVGTGQWEPFQAVKQEGLNIILCKGLVEEEGEKSSVVGGTLAEFPDDVGDSDGGVGGKPSELEG
jgi:hypothetical protein